MKELNIAPKQILAFIFVLMIFSWPAISQTTGDYRTTTSGSWNSIAVWEVYNGTSWVAAATAPNSSNGAITLVSGDSVNITSGVTIDQTVVESGAILRITPGITVNINNDTGDDLTINGTFYMLGNLSYSGAANETVVVNGVMNWHSDGTVAEITSRNTIINVGGVVNISGAGNKSFRYSGGTMNNYGTINWTGTGNIRGASNSFYNMPGGTFYIYNDQEVQYDGGGGSSLVLNNNGLLRKLNGSGTTSFASAILNNYELVEVTSGILALNSGGTHSGTYQMDTLCSLLITGGSQTGLDSLLFTGKGELRMTGGNFNFNGSGLGSLLDTIGTFNFKNGSLGGNGKFVIYGTMNWDPDAGTAEITTMNTTVTSIGTLNISGAGIKSFRYSGGTLHNYGSITWTGTGNIRGASNFFYNHTGGVFNIMNDQETQYDGGGGSSFTFTNDGTLIKTAGSGVTTLGSLNITNNGLIRVETGTLSLASTFYNYNSNTLTGGTYYIMGTLRFNNANILTNQANISLDGPSSQILNNTGLVDALLNFTTNGNNGIFILRNGRNLSTNAASFANNGILDCDTNIFGGPGNFTHTSGAHLILGAPMGIMKTDPLGNIQSAGIRTFSTDAYYTYKGYVPQFSGDGLPQLVRGLTLDNGFGLTLDTNVAVSDTLFMTNGNINTDGDTLTLGTNTTVLGVLMRNNGTVIGHFRRWFNASVTNMTLFPIGTEDHYRPVTLSFTTAPATGGTLAACFHSTDPGILGLPLIESDTLSDVNETGYWTLGSGSGLSGGTYDLDLAASGFEMIDDVSGMHVVKRVDQAAAWGLSGTHLAGTGTPAEPIAHRTGLSNFSDFGIALPRPITHETACFSFIAPDGLTYTNSGLIRIHFPDSVLPDSVLIIDLLIKTVDVGLTITDPMITANQSGATYQWIDCDNSYAAIPGEAQQNFTATYNSDFAVIVTYDGCVDTSNCEAIVTVGIPMNGTTDFRIFPNPSDEIIYLDLASLEGSILVIITDLAGKELYRAIHPGGSIVALRPELSAGIYLIGADDHYTKLIIK